METKNKITPIEINDKIILAVNRLKEKVNTVDLASRNFGMVLASQEQYPAAMKFLAKQGSSIEHTMSQPVKLAEDLRDLGKQLAESLKEVDNDNK